MKKIKKWLALLLILCTAVVMIPQTARQVKAATQSEALVWVRAKVGTVVEADGSSPGSSTYAQCVDLIKAYYIYLVGYSVSGNGADYATNALPSGWQRIQGASPQPGDILVYSGNSSNPYGHVAIYESDYVTYHQNFDNHPYVERITFRYNGLSNPYWGVVRPNFNGGGGAPSLTTAWETSCSYTDDNNAIIHATISTDRSVQFTNAGVNVWDQNGNLVAQASEGTTVAGYYMNIDYNIQGELGTALNPGTDYTYQFWAITKGTTYYSDRGSFRTTGGHNPEGALDLLTGGTESVTVGGWVFDRDDLSANIRLDIYVGGDIGSGHCYQVFADDERTDINVVHPGVGNYHGFYDTITVSETGVQPVYVYAINVGGGSNVLLGSETVTIRESVPGDIDGDGTVTVFDAGLIIDMVYGRAAVDISLADLDGDGAVTVFDAGAVIDLVYGR